MVDQDMHVTGHIEIPTVYSTGSDIDATAAKGQKVVPVAATGNFSATDYQPGWRVILDRGTDREEEGTVASISEGVSITLDANLVYNHTVDADTTTDAESAAEQKVLAVTATTDFAVGETVLVDDGESHEATYTIASIASGVSLTMVEDLLFTHDAAEAVSQTGIGGVVEACLASLSTVLPKKHYKYMALFLPSTWTTAIITFVACNTAYGTFNQVVNADDVGETTIASVAASKVIVLNGEILEAMIALPYIKLRSGTLAAPVDQGRSNKNISYALMR